jgi:hypothetical protein
LLSDVWAHRILGYHIDFAPQQVLKLLFDRNEIEKASPWFEFHQKIDITFRTGFTAGYGAENPHILRAVSAGNSQYFLTLVLQDSARGHNRFSLGVILCYRKEPGKEINDNHDNRDEFPQILDFLFSPFCQLSFLRGRRALSSHISLHDVMPAIGNVWND